MRDAKVEYVQKMTKDIMEEKEIDLIKIAKALWKNAWLLIIGAVVCGGIAFGYTSLFIAPTYKAGTKMYVNNSSISVGGALSSITSGDISAAKSLVETYIVILQTRQVLEEVISQAELTDISYAQLKEMISAAPISSTEVFEIVITDTDHHRAEKIANTIADVLPGKISDIVDGSAVRIVDYAVVPSVKSGPSVKKNSLMGVMAGLIISSAFIVLRTLLDNIVRDEEHLLSNYSEIPILAIVPDMNVEASQKGYRLNNYQK